VRNNIQVILSALFNHSFSNGKRDREAPHQLASKILDEEHTAKKMLQVSATQELSEEVKTTWIELPPSAHQKTNISRDVPAGVTVTTLPVAIVPSSATSTSLTNSSVTGLPWWDGYLDDVLPDKTQGRKLRNLRHQIFTLYRCVPFHIIPAALIDNFCDLSQSIIWNCFHSEHVYPHCYHCAGC